MLTQIKKILEISVPTYIKLMIIFLTIYLGANKGFAIAIDHHIDLQNIQHMDKSAYSAVLPDRYQSSQLATLNKQLIEITEIPYNGKPPSWLKWSYVSTYLSELTAKRFPSLSTHSSKNLGPGSALRHEVENLGGGRYTVLKEKVIFSSSDGSEPGINDRSYHLIVPYRVTTPVMVLLVISSLYFLSVISWKYSRLLYTQSSIFRDLLPGISISLALILIIWAAGEAYLRQNIPFLENKWPAQFDEKLGYVFKPGATIRWTNKTDFWAENKVNSLGFPDREPIIPKPDDTFRILVIGDSFVEAAQVTIDKKFHVLLEEKLRTSQKQKIDTVALGVSGTGQANQLAWLESLHQQIKPDLVMLNFVNNDFANNSPLLGSIRTGWAHDHAPWLFYRYNNSGEIERQEFDKDWELYKLPPVNTSKGKLFAASERKEFLSANNLFREKMKGWYYPDDFDMDFMFYTESPMPPAFEDALKLTGYTIGQYKKLAQKNNFKLMIIATDMTTLDFDDIYKAENPQKRRWVDDLLWLRIKDIAEEHEIPILNLHSSFLSYGDRDDAHFKHDGHWSETGHQWAANAIYKFLTQHTELLQK